MRGNFKRFPLSLFFFTCTHIYKNLTCACDSQAVPGMSKALGSILALQNE